MFAKMLRPLSATLLLSGFSLSASAELNVNLGIVSEYIREGINQTSGNPTWQAGVTWSNPIGLYIGGWGSGLDRSYDRDKAELDAFVGWYIPASENFSFNLSATHFTYHGTNIADEQNYNEFGLRILIDESLSFGFRHAVDYLGTTSARNAYDVNYTLHWDTFDFDFFVAKYEWEDRSAASWARDYWHFRVAAERTWNKWDYRLAIEHANVHGIYNGGTSIHFGIHRYFNIW